MAKTYVLKQNKLTGWWAWNCKASGKNNSAPTKREARDAAKAACSDGFHIVPPSVDADIRNGMLVAFTASNLDERAVTFTAEDIPEACFLFFYGLDCLQLDDLTDAMKATTILKIWGLFRGGVTVTEIKKRHNLRDAQFNLLIRREVQGLQIRVVDDDQIDWKFKPRRRTARPSRVRG